MGSLRKIYKENIYGVIGTLAFHILLVSTFLLADVDMKGKVKEDSVIIEFPEIEPEIEEIIAAKEEQEEIMTDPTENTPSNMNRLTNQASNQTIQKDEFFDEEYQKEMEEAQKLLEDVNHQLEKETVDMDDIKMPVETTEGMDPDSIKNVIYTGESNITYFLENRYHISLPIPVYLAQGGGTVTVDIVVNRRGMVTSSTTRKNASVKDKQIYRYAETAASRTQFNADNSAPDLQTGTIRYVFIAQ